MIRLLTYDLHKPPGADFYGAIAALIPLLLVTAAVEGRRLGEGADAEDPLTMSVLSLAVIGEIAALAGLADGGGNVAASCAVLGVGLLATAVVSPIALRVLSPKSAAWWRRLPSLVGGLVAVMAPVVAALIYVLRLNR